MLKDKFVDRVMGVSCPRPEYDTTSPSESSVREQLEEMWEMLIRAGVELDIESTVPWDDSGVKIPAMYAGYEMDLWVSIRWGSCVWAGLTRKDGCMMLLDFSMRRDPRVINNWFTAHHKDLP